MQPPFQQAIDLARNDDPRIAMLISPEHPLRRHFLTTKLSGADIVHAPGGFQLRLKFFESKNTERLTLDVLDEEIFPTRKLAEEGLALRLAITLVLCCNDQKPNHTQFYINGFPFNVPDDQIAMMRTIHSSLEKRDSVLEECNQSLLALGATNLTTRESLVFLSAETRQILPYMAAIAIINGHNKWPFDTN